MHIFFSGISGAGIGPLALLAHQAGYTVSGSDKQESSYIDYLKQQGITDITTEQSEATIRAVHTEHPIDWIVYSSAVSIENPNHPELVFGREHNIRLSKRDELINTILQDTGKKLIAVAGTHGKTTTTALCIWMCKQLNIPISYSVGAKLSFGDMGEFQQESEYFIYEADEYDRNFLAFKPEISILTGIDWDHPDIYPTREEYNQAFVDFVAQSHYTIGHHNDLDTLDIDAGWEVFSPDENIDTSAISLTGEVNRKNALLVIQTIAEITKSNDYEKLISIINEFPGLSRRFEKIADNIYTDYAHTPEKIRGAIQAAQEVSDKIVIVYEGLHNTRQHFIKHDLAQLFQRAEKLYIVPSYLAREDESLEMLTPEKLCDIVQAPAQRAPAQLDQQLKAQIQEHADAGTLVLCLSAGGGGSLDEWLRKSFAPHRKA